MTLKAVDVFVPGAFPQYTYVDRSAQRLEEALRDALATPGQVVSLSGPSKSGKTVLVERVVGSDLLIPVSGASIRRPEEVWLKVLDWMDVPNTTSETVSAGRKVSAEVSGTGSIALPLVAKAQLGLTGGGEITHEKDAQEIRERRGLPQVVKEIGKSDFVILLDDFHYMDRELQIEIAKMLKEAVRLNVKIVTAAVAHRGDDIVRANPELRGRVRSIDLAYWSSPELLEIARSGFAALNASVDLVHVQKFADESAGSPQLMQSLCLQACFVLRLREKMTGSTLAKFDLGPDTLQMVLEQTSSSTNFKSLVDVLDAGRRVRGTERKTYKFLDGREGDVYRVILRALAANPPHLSFPYDELLRRTVEICSGDSPVGSSVTGTCLHMSKLAQEKFPQERAIDWDEQKQVFDIPDPYLLFYLRWSGRLQEQ